MHLRILQIIVLPIRYETDSLTNTIVFLCLKCEIKTEPIIKFVISINVALPDLYAKHLQTIKVKNIKSDSISNRELLLY